MKKANYTDKQKISFTEKKPLIKKKNPVYFKQPPIQLVLHNSGARYLALPKIMNQNSGQQLDCQRSMSYRIDHCQNEN